MRKRFLRQIKHGYQNYPREMNNLRTGNFGFRQNQDEAKGPLRDPSFILVWLMFPEGNS
jgi:hypothetical protein